MNHDLSTMNNPRSHNIFTINQLLYSNIQVDMKTMPLYRFWLDILKKTRLDAIIHWFNH
ncbi:hypothetical protein ACFJIV_04060 [Mucilaginibacter sp. UC70_90]